MSMNLTLVGKDPKTKECVEVNLLQTPTDVTYHVLSFGTREKQKQAYFEYLDQRLEEVKKDKELYNDWKEIIQEQKNRINSLIDLEFGMI